MKKQERNGMSFGEWFDLYGITDALLYRSFEPWQRVAITKIARRAYDKGVKDGKLVFTKTDK